jgi:hypothetical protein
MSGLHIVVSKPPPFIRGQGFACGWYCWECEELLKGKDGETVTGGCGEVYVVEER